MAQVPAQSFPHAAKSSLGVVSTGVSVVMGGVWATNSRGLEPFGWGAIGLGVAILALTLPMLLRVPMVAFDDRGLRARLPGFGTVPWHEIERVRLVRTGKHSYLVVDRTPEARARRRGGRWPRSLARAAGGKDLAVPLEGLTARPDQIVACVALAHRVARGEPVAFAAGAADRRDG